MCKSDKKPFTTRNIVGYTLPRLHTGKNWYVDFFAYDPTTDRLKRKKFMLDKYTKKERRHMSTLLLTNLTRMLIDGWNPFVNDDRSRSYTTWETVVQRYVDYTKAAEKKGILKPKTAVDYRSRLSGLLSYIKEARVTIKYVNQFDRAFAVDFLDYIVLDLERSAKMTPPCRGCRPGE